MIETDRTGQDGQVEVPVTGVTPGVAAKIQVSIEAVPGETNHENNKGTFLAIFVLTDRAGALRGAAGAAGGDERLSCAQ